MTFSQNSRFILTCAAGAHYRTVCPPGLYRLCQKKLYNFQFLIAEKVNKAQQQHSGGQNIIFLCVRYLNGIMVRCKSYGPSSEEW